MNSFCYTANSGKNFAIAALERHSEERDSESAIRSGLVQDNSEQGLVNLEVWSVLVHEDNRLAGEGDNKPTGQCVDSCGGTVSVEKPERHVEVEQRLIVNLDFEFRAVHKFPHELTISGGDAA